MNNIYDFVVIGAGISACTFARVLNTRFSDASILLVDHGRRIGGRSTTRKSRKNKSLEFDHGLPSINFSSHISKDILTLISPLIDSKKLIDISKDILLIDEFGVLKKTFTNYRSYRSLPCMANFCEEIVNQSNNPKKINFLFQTIAKSLKHINDWRFSCAHSLVPPKVTNATFGQYKTYQQHVNEDIRFCVTKCSLEQALAVYYAQQSRRRRR